MKQLILGLVAVGALVGLASSALARPLVPAENRYRAFTADVPACDDPGVLGTISARFQQRESQYWNSALEISDFDHVRQSGLRINGRDYIPRRYCSAKARLSNNRVHKVTFVVGERLGIIGGTYGVDWCVQGLDRNNAYAPSCHVLQH